MTKIKSRPIALLAAGLLWAGLSQAQGSTDTECNQCLNPLIQLVNN